MEADQLGRFLEKPNDLLQTTETLPGNFQSEHICLLRGRVRQIWKTRQGEDYPVARRALADEPFLGFFSRQILPVSIPHMVLSSHISEVNLSRPIPKADITPGLPPRGREGKHPHRTGRGLLPKSHRHRAGVLVAETRSDADPVGEVHESGTQAGKSQLTVRNHWGELFCKLPVGEIEHKGYRPPVPQRNRHFYNERIVKRPVAVSVFQQGNMGPAVEDAHAQTFGVGDALGLDHQFDAGFARRVAASELLQRGDISQFLLECFQTDGMAIWCQAPVGRARGLVRPIR